MSRLKDVDIALRLVRTKQSAESRGIEFDLSFKRLKQVLNSKKCYFTGVDLEYDNAESPNYLTLDRIDASKGYTDKNVVACAREFNFRKGSVTAEDIVLMYKALKRRKLI